jgi:hypothetical protein
MRELGRPFPSTGALQRGEQICGVFFIYMQNLMNWLDYNQPGQSFLFTMGDLNLHKHLVTINLIYLCGHCVVFWAPYWSCDSTIEYVFNTLQMELQMEINGVDSVFQLVHRINVIIGGMPSFKRYFIHVGFPDN